jgi:hypothetical protein
MSSIQQYNNSIKEGTAARDWRGEEDGEPSENGRRAELCPVTNDYVIYG